MSRSAPTEAEQQLKYRTVYTAEVLKQRSTDSGNYFSRLEQIRIETIRRLYCGGATLDLCCGSGDYTRIVSEMIPDLVGLDFSPELVASARDTIEPPEGSSVRLVVGNARQLPFPNGYFSLLFSFSSLYYIPDVSAAIREARRVLRPNGMAVLEFGALRSLNTVVCRHYPELAAPCHILVQDINRIVSGSGFVVEEWRSFQALPYWGSRPWWLKPLLRSRWRRLMEREVRGRMIDDWISNSRLGRAFAFRHLLVCRAAEDGNV